MAKAGLLRAHTTVNNNADFDDDDDDESDYVVDDNADPPPPHHRHRLIYLNDLNATDDYDDADDEGDNENNHVDDDNADRHLFRNRALAVHISWEGVAGVSEELQNTLVAAWRLVTFSESRWLGIGPSACKWLGGELLGLRSLVDSTLADPSRQKHHIKGYVKATDTDRTVAAISAISSRFCDKTQTALLEDGRLLQQLPEVRDIISTDVGGYDAVIDDDGHDYHRHHHLQHHHHHHHHHNQHQQSSASPSVVIVAISRYHRHHRHHHHLYYQNHHQTCPQ